MKSQPSRLHSTTEVLVRTPGRLVFSFTCAATALLLANCSSDAPTAALTPPAYSLARVGTPHDLLSCPGGADGDVSRATIGPEGGRLSLDGFVMDVPAGAVLDTTTFVMRVPEAKVLKVKIRARDEKHFVFAKPVTITLNYSRCSSVPTSLTAWYIDESTNEELERMPGANNAAAHTFTLQTGHLSGYALAN
jgi:hypothetical protein